MIHCEAAREFSDAVEEIFDEQFNEVPKVDIAIVQGGLVELSSEKQTILSRHFSGILSNPGQVVEHSTKGAIRSEEEIEGSYCRQLISDPMSNVAVCHCISRKQKTM